MASRPTITSRRTRRPAPEPAGRTDAAGAVTIDQTSPTPGPDLLLPHERDEKVGATDGVPSERMRKGAQDVKRGIQDTSRATEADQAYKKLKK